MEVTKQAIYWVDGRLAEIVTLLDVTHERRMQEKLEKLAYYDLKMQLPNMLKLTEDISMSGSGAAYLLCMDINAMRRINDAYGNETGDELLKNIVSWIEGLNIPKSKIYRLGDDEFCLMVSGCSLRQAKKTAKQLYARFEDPWIIMMNGEKVPVYCKISL